MKITVIFGTVRVIVPCGNGELSVRDLIERAVSRYKKATNKHPDDFVEVQVLETCNEQAILDPDDVVNDVLDDKDKVIALFQEQSINRPLHNGGDGMSISSVGTASPDIFQAEISSINAQDSKMRTLSPTKDENHNIMSKLIVVSSAQIKEKPPPPPVAPKPKILRTKEPSVTTIESVPSESDSGICINTSRTYIGSDSSKSEVSNSVSVPRVMRTSETAFVAIGTPLTPNKQFNFNINEDRKTSSSGFEHIDDDDDDNDDDDDGQFSLGRNSARQSMFVDNPVLDRWAELQDKRMYEEREGNIRMHVSAGEREEPAGASMSPTDERTFDDDNMFHNDYLDKQDGSSSNSICSGDSDDTLVINLCPQTPSDLGFTVAGYKTADGRELGLIVRDIFPDGCAARDGRLQVADRIVEINGNNLQELPNKRAEEIFSESIKESKVRLVVSGAHTFVHKSPKKASSQDTNTVQEEVKEQITEQQSVAQQYSVSPEPTNGIEPPPAFRDDRKAPHLNGPQLSSSMKKINKKILLELNKGSDGLGFSITTRDNPAGGCTPIFVKSILAKGAAIEDGRLKSGDQILEVNGTKMTGKSQGEAVNILRSTRGLVKLLIQREEVILSATKPAIQVNEESTRYLRERGKEVLTFKIPLNYSGAAGLGVSVKGKVTEGENGRNSPQDKGIFVKSVIAGGAAQKDGRLQAEDQLLSVNNLSFLGMPNSEAIDKLRTSMQSTRLGQAFIEVTIARDKDDGVHAVGDLNQPEQERPIEAGSPSPFKNAPSVQNVPVVQQPGTEAYQNVPQVSKDSVDGPGSVNDDNSDEDDEFSEEPVVLNFSITKSRNIVQRNESYCFAVNKSKRPIRPSPIMKRESARSSGALRTSMSGNIPNRPSSTVAMPTPPLGSTQEGSVASDGHASQSNASKERNPTPVPPPRVDSYNSSVIANYQIHQHMSNMNGKYGKVNANRSQNQGTVPPVPPPPLFTNDTEQLPSKALDTMRTSEVQENEVFSDSKDVVFAGPELPSDNPFDREGFGRQSMSEKRARASMDAKKTELYQKREKQKLAEEKQKATKTRPSSSHENMNGEGTPSPLRKAKSEGQMQVAAINARVSRETSSSSPMLKSTSESSLKPVVDGERRKHSTSTSNFSFRNAIEGTSTSSLGRDMPNGITRQSQSEDAQDEIPITMTSKADFNAVQQKLTKKPFYRKLKIGKTRRGEYNLSDMEGSPKHSLYAQEALIDFPSEQRYRQLVSHYDGGSQDRSSSMPNRGRKPGKHQSEGKRPSNQTSNTKIGRVIMSEPTRV